MKIKCCLILCMIVSLFLLKNVSCVRTDLGLQEPFTFEIQPFSICKGGKNRKMENMIKIIVNIPEWEGIPDKGYVMCSIDNTKEKVNHYRVSLLEDKESNTLYCLFPNNKFQPFFKELKLSIRFGGISDRKESVFTVIQIHKNEKENSNWKWLHNLFF